MNLSKNFKNLKLRYDLIKTLLINTSKPYQTLQKIKSHVYFL